MTFAAAAALAAAMHEAFVANLKMNVILCAATTAAAC
jgi:hypothetical protein